MAKWNLRDPDDRAKLKEITCRPAYADHPLATVLRAALDLIDDMQRGAAESRTQDFIDKVYKAMHRRPGEG